MTQKQTTSFTLAMAFVTIALAFFTIFVSQAQEATLTSGECGFQVPAGADVECGIMTVAQDRDDASQGTIEIPYALYRSSADEPASDPVVFLQGGPGGESLGTVAQVYASFVAPITETRDLIVLDQRGTGQSVPALNCSSITEASYTDLETVLSVDESVELYRTAFNECRTELEAMGVDTSDYTSESNAADVADLVRALGYEQANIYGASYGTRLAQTIYRDHSDVVRSLILDSALPVELNLYEQQASKASYAFNKFFDACEADVACANTYPDLAGKFAQAVETLATTPAELVITNPLTGESYDVLVTDADMVTALFIMMQVPDFLPAIPQTITNVADGEYNDLVLPLTVTVLLGDSVNFGMFMSVNCHEEVYATTPEILNEAWAVDPLFANFASSAGFGDATNLFNACDVWGAEPFDAFETEPVTGDIPVLALAGEFDPATPVYFTQAAADNFSNSEYYEFPALTHVVALTGGCPTDVMLSFLDDFTAQEVASCINDMPAIQFAGAVAPDDAEMSDDSTSEEASITLSEVTNSEEGWTSLVPDGWQEAQSGVYARGESMLDPTVLVIGLSDTSRDELLGNVAGSLGLDGFGDVTAIVDGEFGTWDVYEAEALGSPLVVGVAEADDMVALVFIQTTADDFDSIYSDVFEPVIMSLRAE